MHKSLFYLLMIVFLGCSSTKPERTSNSNLEQEPNSAKNLDRSIEELANQISSSMTEVGKHKIAVIEFSDLNGNISQFGKYLSEELITKLFIRKKFEVIERQLLAKIIAEQKLSLTGFIDPASAKELGRLIGVDAIISGTITDLGTIFKINARMVSTETGEIFSVAASEVSKDNYVMQLTGDITRNANLSIINKNIVNNKISDENRGFKFEVINCNIKDERITCSLLVTNLKEDRDLRISFKSRIFDEKGNEYHVDRIEFGDKISTDKWISAMMQFTPSYNTVENHLIANVPVRLNLVYYNTKNDSKYLTMLETACIIFLNNSERKDFTVKLKNINLVNN